MKFLKALILATGIAMLAVPLAQAKPSCSDPGLLGQAGYKAVCHAGRCSMQKRSRG